MTQTSTSFSSTSMAAAISAYETSFFDEDEHRVASVRHRIFLVRRSLLRPTVD